MAPFVTLLPCLFAKSSTVYNPFIYFFFQRNSWHKLLHLHGLVFCCSPQDNSLEESKPDDKMVRNSEGAMFGPETDETCVGLMEAPAKQTESETMTLG